MSCVIVVAGILKSVEDEEGLGDGGGELEEKMVDQDLEELVELEVKDMVVALLIRGIEGWLSC